MLKHTRRADGMLVVMMSLVSYLPILFMLLIPPLAPDERVVLEEAVRDDTGLVESVALEVLLNHVASWAADEVAGADLPGLVLELILADPGQFRGDPFLVRGELLRRDRRALGRDDLEAWIILPAGETDEGRVVAVLVPSGAGTGTTFADLPCAVRLPSRFFARLLLASSRPGGGEMVLPLLVGNFPVVSAVGSGSSGAALPGPVLGLLLLLALLIFAGLRFHLRRRFRGGRRFAVVAREDAAEASLGVGELPAEPAEALGVLHEFNQHEEAKP